VRRVAPHVGLIPVEERHEASSVALQRDLGSKQFAQSRHDVDVLREGRHHDTPRRSSRITDDAENVLRLFEETTLVAQTVVTQQLGVVRNHDDDRGTPCVACFERLADATNLKVDLRDHSVVLRAHAPHAGFLLGRLRVVDRQHQVVQSMSLVGHRYRHPDIGRVVHRRKLTGRAVWRMRTQITEMREPTRILSTQPIDEVVGQETRHAVRNRTFVFRRQQANMTRRHVVATLRQPLRPGRVASGQVECDIETRQHTLVGGQSRISGTGRVARVDRLVGVSEQSGRIADTPRQQGDVVERPVEGRAVAEHPMIHLVHPRVQRSATRRTR